MRDKYTITKHKFKLKSMYYLIIRQHSDNEPFIDKIIRLVLFFKIKSKTLPY